MPLDSPCYIDPPRRGAPFKPAFRSAPRAFGRASLPKDKNARKLRMKAERGPAPDAVGGGGGAPSEGLII